MGDVVACKMDVDTVTLPDGETLPATPENRRRAQELWQLDEKGRAERVEGETNEDDLRVERAERELEEMRKQYEQDRAERDREDEQKQREEQQRANEEQEAENRRALERENERLRMQMIEAENEKLRADLVHEQVVRRLLEQLNNKTGASRNHAGMDRTATADGSTAVNLETDLARYSLPVNDIDADIIADFANCVPLESKLRSVDAYGNARVCTTTEFFE